ncbi:MAG: hypothetical protein RR136_03250 [Clostridia bacterium]
MNEGKNKEINFEKILMWIGIISIIIIALVVASNSGTSDSSTNNNSYTKPSSSGTYSDYHKCEYSGCSNYASGKQYCSVHTKKSKCIKSGCSNSEAYASSGYCTYHIAEKMK